MSKALALVIALHFVYISSCQFMKGEKSDTAKHKYTNHLIHEKSPYLLQHAHNPVDWYPWGKEALEKAQRENKLLIISIGYAACHWCHVMERESFEDTAVAALMNEHFVSIKVDREERPDVDDVYMTACQLVSRRGCGWPLNAFALPDGRPIWAGTYFPKDQWMRILQHFADKWRDNPQELIQYADNLTQHIRSMDIVPVDVLDAEPSEWSADFLQQATQRIWSSMDMHLGGRAGQPKFPMPINLRYLMRYSYHTNDPMAEKAWRVTLRKMAQGGIFDQVGGGFARYSVDERWHVPHFEKMLYDNAQLISVYADAYRISGDSFYLDIAERSVEFVQRELRSPEGAYYSSLDADSEGEEGRFYVWTYDEVKELFGEGDTLHIVCDYYGITKEGNWEAGKNVLYIATDLQSLAEKYHSTPSHIREVLEQARHRLFEARQARTRPATDDKILTSWNALMLDAFVAMFRATSNTQYREAAEQLYAFLKKHMWREGGRLYRNYKDGHAGIEAFLDDYANLAQALLHLYEITFNKQYLHDARVLVQYVYDHFVDPNDVLFYYTSDLSDALFTRKKEMEDNVIPSSNSVMAEVLYRLGTMLDSAQYRRRSQKMLHRIVPDIAQTAYPMYFTGWLWVYADQVWHPYEIVITGPKADALRDALMRKYIPHAVFLGSHEREDELSLLKDKWIDGKNTIFVCVDKVCKLPVHSVEDALPMIKPQGGL